MEDYKSIQRKKWLKDKQQREKREAVELYQLKQMELCRINLDKQINQINRLRDYIDLERILSQFEDRLLNCLEFFLGKNLIIAQDLVVHLIRSLIDKNLNYDVIKTSAYEKKIIEKIPSKIRSLLQIVDLPPDYITIDRTMDTSGDEELARKLSGY